MNARIELYQPDPMPPLKLTSDLEDHLRSVQQRYPYIRRAGQLTTRDYLQAFSLFCREKSTLSGERKHCAPIDFDHPDMNAVLEIMPRYKSAAMRGDLETMQEAALDIAKITEAVLYRAAIAKIADILVSPQRVNGGRV